MLEISLFLFFCSGIVIISLVSRYYQTKTNFRKQIDLLEKIIIELKQNLEDQNQKVKLDEELKSRLKVTNTILSNKILEMNMEMFAELFPKK